MRSRDAEVPFRAQSATISASVNVLYRTPLSDLTEEQRSDLCNAASIYLQRLKEHRSAERRNKDAAAHEERDSRGATAPEKTPAKEREEGKKEKRGKKKGRGRR